MQPLPPRSRLGTFPPSFQDNQDSESSIELGLSVRLDRPFHELKEFLLAEFERAYLTRCLENAANLSVASRASGLSRKHLRTLMSKYGIVVRRGLEIESIDCAETFEPASL